MDPGHRGNRCQTIKIRFDVDYTSTRRESVGSTSSRCRCRSLLSGRSHNPQSRTSKLNLTGSPPKLFPRHHVSQAVWYILFLHYKGLLSCSSLGFYRELVHVLKIGWCVWHPILKIWSLFQCIFDWIQAKGLSWSNAESKALNFYCCLSNWPSPAEHTVGYRRQICHLRTVVGVNSL